MITESIVDPDGKILFYTVEDFYQHIVQGDDCFVCGAKNGSKLFNNEHILPDWLLARFGLHDKNITLANLQTLQYGKYTVPCCEECNRLLGETIEVPISNLLKKSYSEICKLVSEDQTYLHLLFKWMTLIFFKAHLKDTQFRWHQDSRKGLEKISDAYDWIDMHHIHCMARQDYTNAIVSPMTTGSIFIMSAIQHESIDRFDFSDNKSGMSIMLRLDEFCIVCVLNDACGSYNIFLNTFSKIKGRLTPTQIREVFTHMTYINIHLKKRPNFHSAFSPDGKYHIEVTTPQQAEIVGQEDEEISLGELLHHVCQGFIGEVENREEILQQIKEGKRRYLFNEKGDFIDYSKDFA